MRLRGYHCSCPCLLVLLGAASLWADVTGSVEGYIRDSSGAVVTGAHVTIVEAATNLKREATTDGQGAYTFLALPPGQIPDHCDSGRVPADYSQRCQPERITEKLMRFDLTLPIGSVQQITNVEANAAVETLSTVLGTTVQSPQILAMPLNGRSYLDLLSLQAGVSPMNTNSGYSDRGPASGLYDRPATSQPMASRNGPTPFW